MQSMQAMTPAINWTPPPGMPPLPPGWVAEWDRIYNSWYFANIETGVSQWQFPGTTPILSPHESPNLSHYDQDAELAARLQAEENSHGPSNVSNHSQHHSQNYSLESDAALAARLQYESTDDDAALAAMLQNQSIESDAALAASLQNGTMESDAALAARLQNGTMESDAALAARLQNGTMEGTVESDAAIAARLQAKYDARNSSRSSGHGSGADSRPQPNHGHFSTDHEIPPELPNRPQASGNMLGKFTNKLTNHVSSSGQPNKYTAPTGPPPKKVRWGLPVAGEIGEMVKDRLKNKNKQGRHD